MSRADRLAGRLTDVDALLVSEPANLRYVTGFTGSNGFAVVGRDVRRFVTDFRYVEQAAEEVPDFDREQGPPQLLAALSDGWPDGPVRLGFDDADVSVRTHGRLREVLPDRVELVAAGGVVEAERAVKEPAELDRIRAAAALADDVYDWLRDFGLVGHAEPRPVPIARNAFVTLDIGARLDGYCSDCTRTWATGDVGEELEEVYGLVLRAQLAGLEAVRPGPEGREVDAVARDLIAAAGHGEHFGHGLGHGVGLEVHEAPRLSRHNADARLEAGNVVTVEPGVYLPGRGGVRIEDLVVVTEDGCDVISGTPKELLTVT
jgi:Xaa-Pro aminopeptidase